MYFVFLSPYSSLVIRGLGPAQGPVLELNSQPRVMDREGPGWESPAVPLYEVCDYDSTSVP